MDLAWFAAPTVALLDWRHLYSHRHIPSHAYERNLNVKSQKRARWPLVICSRLTYSYGKTILVHGCWKWWRTWNAKGWLYWKISTEWSLNFYCLFSTSSGVQKFSSGTNSSPFSWFQRQIEKLMHIPSKINIHLLASFALTTFLGSILFSLIKPVTIPRCFFREQHI